MKYAYIERPPKRASKFCTRIKEREKERFSEECARIDFAMRHAMASFRSHFSWRKENQWVGQFHPIKNQNGPAYVYTGIYALPAIEMKRLDLTFEKTVNLISLQSDQLILILKAPLPDSPSKIPGEVRMPRLWQLGRIVCGFYRTCNTILNCCCVEECSYGNI